jgi:hypothetical protein
MKRKAHLEMCKPLLHTVGANSLREGKEDLYEYMRYERIVDNRANSTSIVSGLAR